MKISHFPINLCIALFLCSFNASSAIVTFNFEGFVSGVENEEQVFFDPLETMGQSVAGSFTLDTSAPIRGRVETNWWWWSVHDNDRPALTSSVEFGDMLFRLNNEGVYQAEYDEYYPEEMLEMYDGPTFDDGHIGDGISLKDYARKTTLFSNGSLERTLHLSFGFRDLINDFLAFDEDTLLRDKMPDFSSPVSWFDNDLTSDTQSGGGSLRLIERVDDLNAGVTYPVDSTVRFTLTSVETVKVSSPTMNFSFYFFVVLLFVVKVHKRNLSFNNINALENFTEK
tara:strand:+ start:190 stop:1038 length:849 start_codon:yes stop_codon:yes gene_type:complete